jgi:hypothetical protein
MTKSTVNRLQKIDIRQHKNLGDGAVAMHITINGVTRIIQVITTPCNYGGFRHWFACPYCHRKCCIIYNANSGLACRLCYRLCYPIENETKPDRAVTQAWKIRRKLGWNYGGIGDRGEKPKNMQQRTFERLAQRERDYSQVFYNSVGLWIGKRFL